MTHKLKILPKWFDDVLNERKKFEIRKNDRDFKVGDKLLLQEWERGKYTGREILKEIEYIYHGDGTYGLSEEYCILGLKPKILMLSTDIVEVVRCKDCRYVWEHENGYYECGYGFCEVRADFFCADGERRETE